MTEPLTTTCGLLFDRWRSALQFRPEAWIVRRIQHGTVWRNPPAQLLLSRPELTTWEEVSATVHPDDLQASEDCQERALKLGTVESHYLRRPIGLLNLTHAADVCRSCSLLCAVIVSLARPASCAVVGSPLPPSSSPAQ
jgi:hypothetical protein